MAGSSGGGGYSYTSTAMAFSVSTAIPWNMYTSDPYWGEGASDNSWEIKTMEPEVIKIEWCQWCGSEFYPHPYYQGNCICCGGPRNWEKDYH
jgi:hypothetical protein